jgi:hypothetical protein
VVPSRRIRLCLRDLYHLDLVEMIERETRQFELWEIEDPEDPLFQSAYDALWHAFGEQGEMERIDVIRAFLQDDPFVPSPSGTFMKYFLIVVRDSAGQLCGVRDGTVLVNTSYAQDLCVVYLSHLFMLPGSRGTVASYWLRISPVEVAMDYMAQLHARELLRLPAPEQPDRYFGMRLNLVSEMEYFSPDELASLRRVLFYGRGGFDALNPRHFPYLQPDFRNPAEIRDTGNCPLPFMILVRRMGRERQASMAIEEASAVMRLLYDDFASHCEPELLANSLQLVLDRLAERARHKDFVELLPLPTGPRNLARLKRLFRYAIFKRYYQGSSPVVTRYLQGPMRDLLAQDPRYLEREIERIARELEARPHYVYASRKGSRED